MVVNCPVWEWVRRGNVYFNSGLWPAVRFQPTLYLFIWAASVRLAISQAEPPQFDVIAHNFYVVWLVLGIGGPVLSLLSWWLIEKRRAHWRYAGMWLRLSADIQVFTVMFSYHLVHVLDQNPSEAKVFGRYISAAAMAFVLMLIIRDVWTLVVTERVAVQIRRGVR